MRDAVLRWSTVFVMFAAFAGHVGAPLAWPLAVLGTGVFLALLARRFTPHLWIPVAAAFTLRGLLALAHWAGMALPDDRADAVKFDGDAWAMAQGPLDAPPLGSAAYSWLLSLLYRITGHEPWAGEALNVLLGTLLVWGVGMLAMSLWGPKAARAAATAAAIFPVLILYSVVLVREAVMVTGMVWGTWALVRWWKEPRLASGAAAVLLWMIPASMHTGLQFTAPAIVLLGAFRLARGIGASPRRRTVLATMFVPLYLMAVFSVASSPLWPVSSLPEPSMQPASDGIEPYEEGTSNGTATDGASNGTGTDGASNGTGPDGSQTRSGSAQDPQKGPPLAGVAKMQDDRVSGRTAYPSWMTVESWADAVWLGPVRIFMLAFAPFPWMASAWKDLIGVGDALLYAGVAAGFWATRRHWTGTRALLVLAVAAVGFSIFALGTSNYGTGIRHRAKFAPLLLAALPPQAWSFRLPGRPEGTTLLTDLGQLQDLLERGPHRQDAAARGQ